MEKIIIVKYGEIALKGKNRRFFEDLLVRNIKIALRGYDFELFKTHGRIFLDGLTPVLDQVLPILQEVFGIVELSVGVRVGLDMEAIKEAGIWVMEDAIGSDKASFKVETRRSNKGFSYKSPEISKIVGGTINTTIENISVDVHQPNYVLNIEVREQVYLYAKRIKAIGGMPYGCGGKSVLLLSGGIDSPVAGYLMARRGVELVAVHFHSFPFTSERAQEKVYDLGRKLCKYIGGLKLYNINILALQTAINEHCPSKQSTILQRRFMTRIAQEVAMKEGALSLITGESIGQVASQTMESLLVTNSTVDLPIFRPLIAMDKQDIIEVAKKIDTFELSILPFEDCCTVFLPEKVVTRPKLEDILASEEKLAVDELVAEAMEAAEIIKL